MKLGNVPNLLPKEKKLPESYFGLPDKISKKMGYNQCLSEISKKEICLDIFKVADLLIVNSYVPISRGEADNLATAIAISLDEILKVKESK